MILAMSDISLWSGSSRARFSDIETLADILAKNQFSADAVADFCFGQWHMAALAAKVQDPSREAQAIVVRLLRARERSHALEHGPVGTSSRNGPFERWLARYRRRLEEAIRASTR